MSNLLVKIREVTQIVTIRINFCDLIIIHFINADECMKNQILYMDGSLSLLYFTQNFKRSLMPIAPTD